MNGEDSGRGSSIGGGKGSSDAQSLKQSSPSKNGPNDGENNALPPAAQGSSSGNSGGGEDDPPKKPTKIREEDEGEEDEAEDESSEDDDDDAKCHEVNTTSKETETSLCEKSCFIKMEKSFENGHVVDNNKDDDVKPNLDELKSQGSHLNDGPVRKARGRPRKYPIQTDTSGNPIIKRPSKEKEPKKYKPTDVVRRKRKIKKENESKPINLARQKYLESLKNKESSSWDKEVADTLQNVIKIARKSKKFKAIGRPRKRPLEEGEKVVKIRKKREKKVKLGVMAYPIVEIKKKSENDWDTVEAKYTVPGFCCNDCGAVYQSTAALRRHQNYECGKDPQFKCDECDYAAKHKGTLKSHIKNRHLPKSDPEDLQKKPRKPRKPRVLLIPRAPSPI